MMSMSTSQKIKELRTWLEAYPSDYIERLIDLYTVDDSLPSTIESVLRDEIDRQWRAHRGLDARGRTNVEIVEDFYKTAREAIKIKSEDGVPSLLALLINHTMEQTEYIKLLLEKES